MNLFINLYIIVNVIMLLAEALPNNPKTVNELSSLIHSTASIADDIAEELTKCTGSINLSSISIWIDPIGVYIIPISYLPY